MDIEHANKEALDLFLNFDYEKAEDTCKSIIKNCPDNSEAWALLRAIFFENKHPDALEKDIERFEGELRFNLTQESFIRIQSNLAEIFSDLGRAFHNAGKSSRAISCYRKALKLHPHLVDAYFHLSDIYHEKGRLSSGIPFVRNIRWTPNKLIVHVDQERKLLYLAVPKAGYTTIKHALFWKPLFGNRTPQEIMTRMHDILGYSHVRALDQYKDYFKFTVIRDPYRRFMSGFYGFVYKKRNSVLSKDLGISDYPESIFSDPNAFIHKVNREILNRNPHTALQTYLLPETLFALDYVAQLENIEELEKKLSHILMEKIKFDWLHRGKGIDYYAINMDTDRFNNIFMEDYNTLKEYYSPLKNTSFHKLR
jgi:tetratricopeptide (TPR) repeat protein